MKLYKSVLFSALLLSASAQAANVAFTFSDDASVGLSGRPHVSGAVSGILYGLASDGASQMPTSIEFTSNVSFVGITDVTINPIENNFVPAGGGFSLTGGVVTSADYTLNFDDPVTGGKQLRLNNGTLNLLMWNGGSGPFVVTGNAGGFSAVTFSSIVSVPEPETYMMMLAGLGLLVFGTRCGKRKVA